MDELINQINTIADNVGTFFLLIAGAWYFYTENQKNSKDKDQTYQKLNERITILETLIETKNDEIVELNKKLAKVEGRLISQEIYQGLFNQMEELIKVIKKTN